MSIEIINGEAWNVTTTPSGTVIREIVSAPQPASRIISTGDFLKRFDMEKLGAILDDALSPNASPDARTLKGFIEVLRSVNEVDLDDPMTIGGLTVAVSRIPEFAQADMDAILA